MEKSRWKMESNHKAPLCAERHCFMWSVCHEGNKSSSTLSLLYTVATLMKFAECIISQNPLPNTISNINDTRKSMAITLLDASGICIVLLIYLYSMSIFRRTTTKLLSGLRNV